MTKKKDNKLTCPCCKSTVYLSSLKKTLDRQTWIWGMTTKLKIEDLLNGDYQWACDACLDSGKAMQGNPQKQLYCDFNPYLAYFDIAKTCKNCGKDYVFFKQEQLLWYEKLKFWVQSRPKYCAECRKIKRQKKNLNKELFRLLSKKENLQIEDMKGSLVLCWLNSVTKCTQTRKLSS